MTETFNIMDEFPSKYLKAADLKGKEVRVVMDRVVKEEVSSEMKNILYFEGHSKGVVLNKTNANNISILYGLDHINDWPGQPVILYPSMTDFQGKTVPCIRIKPQAAKHPLPKTRAAMKAVESENPAEGMDTGEIIGDEIPF